MLKPIMTIEVLEPILTDTDDEFLYKSDLHPLETQYNLDNIINIVDDAVVAIEHLKQYKILTSSTTNKETHSALRLAVEHLRSRMQFKDSNVSLESHSTPQISLENAITDTAKKIWEAIKRAIKQVLEKIKMFFISILDSKKDLINKFKKNIEICNDKIKLDAKIKNNDFVLATGENKRLFVFGTKDHIYSGMNFVKALKETLSNEEKIASTTQPLIDELFVIIEKIKEDELKVERDKKTKDVIDVEAVDRRLLAIGSESFTFNEYNIFDKFFKRFFSETPLYFYIDVAFKTKTVSINKNELKNGNLQVDVNDPRLFTKRLDFSYFDKDNLNYNIPPLTAQECLFVCNLSVEYLNSIKDSQKSIKYLTDVLKEVENTSKDNNAIDFSNFINTIKFGIKLTNELSVKLLHENLLTLKQVNLYVRKSLAVNV
jgi:hypothetical protein